MSAPAEHQQQQSASDDLAMNAVLYGLGALVALVLAPIALVALVFALGIEHKGWRRWPIALVGSLLVLGGVAVGAHATYAATVAEAGMHARDAAFDSAERGVGGRGGAGGDRHRWNSTDPYEPIHLLGVVPGALFFGPLGGVVLHVVWLHHNESEQTRHARELSAKRRASKVAQRHVTRAKTWPEPPGRTVLGVPLEGSLRAWTPRIGWRRYVAPEVEVWQRHAVIVGETGAGKSVTAEAIAAEHLRLGWPVICVDAKADPSTRRQFLALCASMGVEAVDGSTRPIDGWRGGSEKVVDRLMATQDFTEPFYESVTRSVLSAAIGDHRVRAFDEVLDRITALARDRAWLGRGLMGEVRRERIIELLMGVYGRYDGVARAVSGALDGDWSHEDVQAAYVPVGRPESRDHAAQVGAFILEDLLDFALARKPPGGRVLVMVDEFSKLSHRPGAAVQMVERARSFGVSFLLIGQTWASLGDDAATRDRIAGTVGTVIVHRLKQPDEVAALAGTDFHMERTEQTVEDFGTQRTGLGSQRRGERYVVHPNELRRLGLGECFVIHEGRAVRMRVRPPYGWEAPERGRLCHP